MPWPRKCPLCAKIDRNPGEWAGCCPWCRGTYRRSGPGIPEFQGILPGIAPLMLFYRALFPTPVVMVAAAGAFFRALGQALFDDLGRLRWPERLRQSMAVDHGAGLGLGQLEIARGQDQDGFGPVAIEPDGEVGTVGATGASAGLAAWVARRLRMA